EFLRHRSGYAIDPALGRYSGAHQTERLPGAFADCSPDRWGRNLIAAKVRAQALQDGRTPPSVSDVGFLIGVNDLTRQGALRFRTSPDGPYLAPDPDVPKTVELPRLLHAGDIVAHGGSDDLAAIKTLLDAGSGSLGGARPKACVRDGGRLLIAKFPHHTDEWDVMAWEKTALDLAQRAGVDVPRTELARVDGRSVLLSERFDRDGEQRIGYISAMTLVQGRDGDPLDYTEVAETLPEYGSRTSRDLRQLWRRIAYSVAIHNTDDHLRNHGFLRDGASGWRLSPAFDINPNPDVSAERVTGIGGARGRTDELASLMAYTDTFALSETEATTVLGEIDQATRGWRAVAAAHGIGKSEQDRFGAAFDGLRHEMRGLAMGNATHPAGQPRDTSGRFASGRPLRR
ncbi:MAG TPA: HipA domain-containing protein, partial [Mycobacteriales bacterium]|nr:HipA domain-containing protein [Mycobacteriales bacterium]